MVINHIRILCRGLQRKNLITVCKVVTVGSCLPEWMVAILRILASDSEVTVWFCTFKVPLTQTHTSKCYASITFFFFFKGGLTPSAELKLMPSRSKVTRSPDWASHAPFPFINWTLPLTWDSNIWPWAQELCAPVTELARHPGMFCSLMSGSRHWVERKGIDTEVLRF